ncbi:hypothetical protein M404DRAFT_949152 [Pisolithus tinctorius Marx 270]|uniref:Uncharacterized protein n=1 Tax=Pisolithus tinctorius Marx 270 TaxID=870435 RepID=A0A0C3J7S6_PISTI|nr:hypothetical protein M404DRAFT_949152 [Pisolithus tinctorius Marx 270]
MPGHAFRIRGATELLLQGVPPDVITTQGRWESQAFFIIGVKSVAFSLCSSLLLLIPPISFPLIQ